MEQKEMNFWDLCVACSHAIGRGCQGCGRILARMVRLTYRYWWIVITIIALGIGAAIYYSRPDNLTYKVRAVAMLNGASIQQFEQAFAPLQSAKQLPNAPLSQAIYDHTVWGFETFRVVDCLGDGTADFIDLKRKTQPTDTVNVQMHDRICVQYRIKAKNMDQIPMIEEGVLDFLNHNPALQDAYRVYLPNLKDEVVFNHRQAQKLDSLTSHYYFRGAFGGDSFTQMREGTVVMSDWSDWRVRLFLEKLYEQREYLQRRDQRLQLASAPVTVENHFSVFPVPVNARRKCIVLFGLLAWICGCAIAEIVDRRKALLEWLRA